MKRVAKLAVVDLYVPRGEDENRTLVREKRHRLRDAGGLAAELFGGELHRGGGFGEGVHALGETELFKMGVGDVEGHGGSKKRGDDSSFSYGCAVRGRTLGRIP